MQWEDEGYTPSNSQDENIAAQNITIENDRYYSINDFEKMINAILDLKCIKQKLK